MFIKGTHVYTKSLLAIVVLSSKLCLGAEEQINEETAMPQSPLVTTQQMIEIKKLEIEFANKQIELANKQLEIERLKNQSDIEQKNKELESLKLQLEISKNNNLTQINTALIQTGGAITATVVEGITQYNCEALKNRRSSPIPALFQYQVPSPFLLSQNNANPKQQLWSQSLTNSSHSSSKGVSVVNNPTKELEKSSLDLKSSNLPSTSSSRLSQKIEQRKSSLTTNFGLTEGFKGSDIRINSGSTFSPNAQLPGGSTAFPLQTTLPVRGKQAELRSSLSQSQPVLKTSNLSQPQPALKMPSTFKNN